MGKNLMVRTGNRQQALKYSERLLIYLRRWSLEELSQQTGLSVETLTEMRGKTPFVLMFEDMSALNVISKCIGMPFRV